MAFWEYGEYVCEALVALACIGEYVASFTKWSEREPRAAKRLEKRATILLIFGLTVGFLCLAQTNELSGRVIGYLGEQAEKANDKSRLAIESSETAITKSEKAQGVASNALALARGARHDVEVVGKDLDSSKKQVSTLSAKLTEANRKTDKELQARLKLEGQLINVEVCNAPRVILSWSANGKTSIDKLKPLAGRTVFIEYLVDNEAYRAARNIAETLISANWDVRPLKPVYGIEDGVVVQPYVARPGAQGPQDEWRAGEVADALVDFLHSYNWQVQRGWPTDAAGHLLHDDSILPPGSLRIQVGLYPAIMCVPPPGAAQLSHALTEAEKKWESGRTELQRRRQESRRKMLEPLPPEQRKLMEERLEEFDREDEKIMSRDSNPCQSFPQSLFRQ